MKKFFKSERGWNMGMRRIFWVMVCTALVLFLAGHTQATAAVVLLLSTDNADTDTAIKTTLEGLGHQVDIGVHYWMFDGTELVNYDAVLLVPSHNYASGDMPAAGQTALIDFVSSGRGLVTGEWTVWKRGAQGTLATLSDAIPVVATSAFRVAGSVTYTSVMPDDILNAGVPSPFTFMADDIAGTETQFAAKNGATTFYGSDYPGGGDGVIGWDFGMGRVISFSTVMGPMELGDSNYSQLLSNAITWSTTQPGSPQANQ